MDYIKLLSNQIDGVGKAEGPDLALPAKLERLLVLILKSLLKETLLAKPLMAKGREKE